MKFSRDEVALRMLESIVVGRLSSMSGKEVRTPAHYDLAVIIAFDLADAFLRVVEAGSKGAAEGGAS